MLLAETNMTQSNTLLIIQILTIVISGITLVISGLSMFFSYRATGLDRRSANYREIIAKQRLREYNQIKESLSEFLWTVINYRHSGSEESKALYKKAYLHLSCLFKPQYDEDSAILTCMEKLNKSLESLSDKSEEGQSAIDAQIKELGIMVSAYTAANWCCIKAEIGKSTKLTYEESKVRYREIKEQIEKKYHE